VFARFGHLLLVVALMGATGAHWAVLQSVAWTTMLADNVHTAPLQTAFQRTFDGKHPCALCKQIAQGRQSEKKSDLQTSLRKLEFLHSPFGFVAAPPRTFHLLAADGSHASLVAYPPPVPPPRSPLA
jgi:hypothetical protein